VSQDIQSNIYVLRHLDGKSDYHNE